MDVLRPDDPNRTGEIAYPPEPQTATQDPNQRDIRIEPDQAEGPARPLLAGEIAVLAPVEPGPGQVSEEYQAPASAPTEVFVPAEGVMLIDRRAQIKPGPDGVWLVQFEQIPNAPRPIAPMILLPCAWLESMQAEVTEADQPVVFLLTGEVTAYHVDRYFLVHRALRVVDQPEP